MRSRLATGTVFHKRHAPTVHTLKTSYASLLVDLDELSSLDATLKLFSAGGFNLTSLREADFGVGVTPLKVQIATRLQEVGLKTPPARVEMLAAPRILGYAFNPITTFFAYDREDDLCGVIFEVNSTFGERCHYPFLVAPGDCAPMQFECPKVMRVSPFNRVEGTYKFQLTRDNAGYRLGLQYEDANGLNLTASHAAQFKPLNDAGLVRGFGAVPFTMIKTMAGIHWNALLLWLKGVKFVPARRATHAKSQQSSAAIIKSQ